MIDFLWGMVVGGIITFVVILAIADQQPDAPAPDVQKDTRHESVMIALETNHLVETNDYPVRPETFQRVCWLLHKDYKYTHLAMTGRGKPLSRAEYIRLGGWFVRRHWMVRNPSDGTYSPTDEGRRLIHATITRVHGTRAWKGRG